MAQQPDRQLDPSLPNAARMQAIGDLLARGIRRLNDMKRRKAREEIHAQVPTTCLDLQPESSVTVPDARVVGLAPPLRPLRVPATAHAPARTARSRRARCGA